MESAAPSNQDTIRKDATQNRERVVEVARELFQRQGVAATSMNQIAQEAGVGAGTLYRNFAHKGEVCLALLRGDMGQFKQRVEVLLAGENAPFAALDKLSLLLDELLKMTEANKPLLIGMHEAFVGKKRLDIYQSEYYLWLNTLFAGLLQSAIDQEEILPLDTAFTADAIFAAISPTLFVFQQNHRGFDRARILAGMQRLFVDGLRTRQRQ